MTDAEIIEIIAEGIVDGTDMDCTPADQARAVLKALRDAGVLQEWKPFPAPVWERVIVAGWQETSGTVEGYWWYHEDDADDEGKPYNRPNARLWVSLDKILPELPEAPQ